MLPITLPNEAMEYGKQIRRLATLGEGRPTTPWTGLTSLLKFIDNTDDTCQKPALISIVTIPAETATNAGLDPAPGVSVKDVEGWWGLLGQMPSLADPSSQLLIVENICP